MKPQKISISEAAKILGVNQNTLAKMIKVFQKETNVVKIPHFSANSLQAYAKFTEIFEFDDNLNSWIFKSSSKPTQRNTMKEND